MLHLPALQSFPVLASGTGAIALPQSGTDFTHGIFRDAVQQFPDVFQEVSIEEDPKAFKNHFNKNHGDFFVRFEAARATHPSGIDVARWIHDQVLDRLVYVSETHSTPLREHMQGAVDPLPLESLELRRRDSRPIYQIAVPIRQRHQESAHRRHLPLSNHPINQYLYTARGYELAEAIDLFYSGKKMNEAAMHDLHWCLAEGALDLSAQIFVVMGAGAETGPTKQLLSAGATVLWIDAQSVGDWLDAEGITNGTVVCPARPHGNTDLAGEPLRIAAIIKRFVEEYGRGDKAHFVNVAYADRLACELAAAQNIITQSCQDYIQSMSLYISPTIPNEIDSVDVHDDEAFHTVNGRSWAWSIVPLQGMLYQLAQYGVKLLGGLAMAADQDVFEVRLDTANIAETESLKQRVEFALAFAGAPEIGAETFPPETAAAMQAHLLIHDRLNKTRTPWNELNAEERIQQARRRKVHGNILTLGGILEQHITRAGLKGIKHRPDLILAMTKRLMGRG